MKISHDWDEETPEAKARWFQSLPMEERMRLFCEITEMLLQLNPEIVEKKLNARPASGRVQIIERK